MELADEKVFGLATGEKFSSKSSQAQAKEVAIAPRTAKKQQKRSIVRPSQTNSVLGRLKKAAAQSPDASATPQNLSRQKFHSLKAQS